MKRIALCLHGLLRDYDKALPSWTRFIDKYKPDIYWHTWEDVPVYGIFNRPKYGCVQAPEDYSWITDKILDYSSTARNVNPQLDSMDRVLLNIDIRIPYDFIVRSRWDLVLHNPEMLDFYLLNPDKFYICSNHWRGSNDIFDDNIMVGSADNIRKHNVLGWYLWGVQNETKIMPSGEQLFYQYFKEYDLLKDLIRTEALDFTLARNL